MLKLSDSTEGWSRSVTKTLRNAPRSSAEIIAETPSDNNGPLPLSDFGKATFSSNTVDGASLGSTNSDSIDMVDSSGTTQATTSGLSGGSTFFVTWDRLNYRRGTRQPVASEVPRIESALGRVPWISAIDWV